MMTRYQASFRFIPSDYLDEYIAATNEAYTIYSTTGQLVSEGYYSYC